MTESLSVVKDDKRIITDMAFGVDAKLLGRKLATPWQRGIAMLVDATAVLLLTEVSGVFWGLFAGLAFMRAGKKQDAKNWRITRYLLRLFGALVLFVSVVVLVSDFSDEEPITPTPLNVDEGGTVTGEALSLSNLLAYGNLTADIIAFNAGLEKEDNCRLECQHANIQSFIQKLESNGLGRTDAVDFVVESLPDSYFSSEQDKVSYKSALLKIETTINQIGAATHTNSNILDKEKLASDIRHSVKDVSTQYVENATDAEPDEKTDEPVYSMLAFVKALIADLGLGFGWAALYFTAFSAWWRGQTPGKKLMGIRTIQLDGTYMSAWDAFGRYGGYGAGFATGLMGFLQIFWDPNRQAIQDKISATVVIQGDLDAAVVANDSN